MTHQVRHQHIDDIVLQSEVLHDNYYSDNRYGGPCRMFDNLAFALALAKYKNWELP